MNYRQIQSVIEGLLFAAGDEGLDAKQIADVLEMQTHEVTGLLKQMTEAYKQEERGIQIMEIAGAFQLTTLPAHAPYFERLAQSPTRSSLSQAALETLAIIAYKQPITRVDIEQIRGVKADRALQTLTAKNLILEVGRAEQIGRPILYGTTKSFLDYFGLAGLHELPEAAFLQNPDDLEEETRMLFEKLEGHQLTIDDAE
ncbi:SMC-Scp complex subunit ScpB [Paenibacillus ginsengarvi]|uniref:Segregation and condensation protein B n=1 Tax=Paenibacillus ginsengarvi TaxID=400777 RepID=A0A3B0CKT2_9BACL|nr:SMC-Scp complex subunit ScpB [Paenibacillus ginsengarvi]RKN84636.1 SMC-Scp complex subunit ScpB [Paenibacillus ginsengarvi]